MSQTVSGQVQEVSLQPGRPDLMTVTIAGQQLAQQFDLGVGVVLCDGAIVNVAGLFEWLAKTTACNVTLRPLIERYGLSLHTEFTKDKP